MVPTLVPTLNNGLRRIDANQDNQILLIFNIKNAFNELWRTTLNYI